MTLSYFLRSDEIFQGHLDFQDNMLMTYIVWFPVHTLLAGNHQTLNLNPD